MSLAPLAAIALLLGAALLGSAAAAAGSVACPSDEACPAAAGSAMLQTGAEKRGSQNQSPSIEGRVATIDAELASLENRVSIMMSTVGIQGAALMAKSDGRYQRYKDLLRNKYDAQALVDVVQDLEAKADNVKASLTDVENMVSGSNLALVEKKTKQTPNSLTNRVTALEEVVSSLKDRATSMEEKITGMASKA
jgi:hypothetical protein